jgi:phage/plasmid-like protein (TIGR03299 family)
MGNSNIDRILVREQDLATAVARNGSRAELVSSLAEVKSKLFNFQILEAPVQYDTSTTAAGEGTVRTASRGKVLYRSDNGNDVGLVGAGFPVHQYDEWLADSLALIVDDSDIVVQSAGLIGGGSKAWVQVTRPETTTTKAGFEIKPMILAGTGVDGNTATTFRRNAIGIVCQNTYAASFSGKADVSIRHTRNSGFQLDTVRSALGVMFEIEDEFSREVDELFELEVTDRQFEALVKQYIGEPDPNAKSTRSQTIFDRKFDELTGMWRNDNRVAPWRGTGLGAMQAFSTWQQHVASVKGATRAERNADNLLSGKGDKFDTQIRELIGTLA